MTKLWLELHVGEGEARKRHAIQLEVNDELLEPSRVDDLRGEISQMALMLADWWEEKCGAIDDRYAELMLGTRDLIGEARFAELLSEAPVSMAVRQRLEKAGVVFPV